MQSYAAGKYNVFVLKDNYHVNVTALGIYWQIICVGGIGKDASVV